MNEEEKQAIKYFYNLRATIDESNMLFDEDINVKCGKETIKQITAILNLLEKKDKEIQYQKEINKTEQNRHKQTEKSLKGQLQKKDKMIDLMVEEFKKIFSEGEPCDLDHEMECKKYKECKDCIKQYFERKVENGN